MKNKPKSIRVLKIRVRNSWASHACNEDLEHLKLKNRVILYPKPSLSLRLLGNTQLQITSREIIFTLNRRRVTIK
jgi:hypothetical protein